MRAALFPRYPLDFSQEASVILKKPEVLFPSNREPNPPGTQSKKEAGDDEMPGITVPFKPNEAVSHHKDGKNTTNLFPDYPKVKF